MSSDDQTEELETEGAGSSPEEPAARVAFSFDDFQRYVEAERESRRERYRRELQNPQYTDRLVEAASSYLRREDFAPGDLVTWKQYLKSMEFPDYGAPAVFVRYLTAEDPRPEEPRIDQDCLIGWLDEELDLIVNRANSHRFTAWKSLP